VNQVLLETTHMIDSDDRCVWMTEGETREFRVEAKRFGEALRRAFEAKVTIVINKSDSEAAALSVTKQYHYYDELKTRPVVKMLNRGAPILTIRPGEPAHLRLKALRSGAAVVFCQDRRNASVSPNFRLDFYINIRVLPADRDLARKKLTFELVYKEVLQYYSLIHPAMSLIFDMSKESHWTPYWAQRVLERIDPAVKDRYKYMPRTRDMSEGKRTLLTRWCRFVIKTKTKVDSFNNPGKI